MWACSLPSVYFVSINSGLNPTDRHKDPSANGKEIFITSFFKRDDNGAAIVYVMAVPSYDWLHQNPRESYKHDHHSLWFFFFSGTSQLMGTAGLTLKDIEWIEPPKAELFNLHSWYRVKYICRELHPSTWQIRIGEHCGGRVSDRGSEQPLFPP
jgi:hypothetical protein